MKMRLGKNRPKMALNISTGIPLNVIVPGNFSEAETKCADETTKMIECQRSKTENTEFEEEEGHLVLWIRPSLFMAAYFTANLLLTLHTKWLLSVTKFQHPWIISGLHIVVSGLGAWITLKATGYQFVKLKRPLAIRLAFFSTLYSINIAMSNVSMKYVSLSLHQITRSATPLVTLLFEFLILGKKANGWLMVSLLLVVAGILFTVLGEMDGLEYSTFGLFLTITGVVLSSLKGVMTNFMLVGGLKMHPLELIALVAPLASSQCFLASAAAGEVTSIYKQYSSQQFDWFLAAGLLANAVLAFFLNWVSFAVNKETSALAMTVAGNVKQAVSIGLAMIIFHTPLTVLNGIGIVTTLAGGAWYSGISLQLKRTAKSAILV